MAKWNYFRSRRCFSLTILRRTPSAPAGGAIQVLRTKVRLTMNIVPRVLVQRDLHVEDLVLRLVGGKLFIRHNASR
jgi:hypothetical protein